jgi:hypothetical protein
MQLHERRHPATAVSLTAVAAAVVAIVSVILNPLVALAAAAIALVCEVIGFVRLRNALGVVVLAFGLLPFLLAIFLLVRLASTGDPG